MTAILPHGDRAAREMSMRLGGTYADNAAITALTAGDRAAGMLVVNLATQLSWVYDAASAAGGGAGVLVPDDAPATGRWLVHATGTGLAAASVLTTHVGDGAALAGGVGVTGVPYVIYAPLVDGLAGAADDVTVTTSVPCKSLLINVELVLSVADAGDTLTVRDAAAGAGNALSNALSVAATGVVRWAHTDCPTLAAGSDIYLRRTNDACVGFAVLTLLRIA